MPNDILKDYTDIRTMIFLSLMVTDVTKRNGLNIPHNFDKPSDHHFGSRNLINTKIRDYILNERFQGALLFCTILPLRM